MSESHFVGKVVTGFDVERFVIDGGGPGAQVIKLVKIQFNDGSWIQLEPDDVSSIKMSMVGPPPPLRRS